MVKEIPVYLFLGFLESGKTTFIQETFEDERFESGEKTLLLVCEEGEVEFDPSKFRVKGAAVETIPAEALSLSVLAALQKKHKAERVVVEYNGMCELTKLFDAMPDGWLIAQVMTFFNAPDFLSFNKNMRQLVFDKVQYADMVVFNRFCEEFSKEEFHKIIRGISRRPQIVYEFEGGRADYDDIEDPLPFDIEADVIEIADRDYAFFYRDLMEDPEKYAGKTVHFKGLAATDKRMKAGTVVLGRHIMTCCEADIAYSGMVVRYTGKLSVKTRDWLEVTGRIKIEYDKIYGQKGPVLKADSLEFCEKPTEELATFY